MAVQTIYTGKGLQAPQTKGYAMQALSQFSRQSHARTTKAVEQGYKDRDKFAEMLKLDPVYASSQVAQKRIADIMDGYIDEMTMMNKNRTSSMTTKDLIGMQQARGMAMAEMNYIKGANDEFMQAAKMYNSAPQKYDAETFEKYKETWFNEGVRPDGPPLLPAAKHAIVAGMQNLKDQGMKIEYSDVSRENISSREDRITQKGMWNIPNNVGMEDIISLSMTQEQPWNIQKTFTGKNVSDAERQKYINMAKGDDMLAGNLWYYKNMEEYLRGEHTKFKSVNARAPRIDPNAREAMKNRFSDDGNVYYFDNDQAFQRDQVNLSLGGSGEGMAILKPMLLNVPVKDLEFTEDIKFDEGSSIWVQPQQVLFENGNIEYAIDPSKNGEVWVTAENEDDVPFDEILEADPLPNGKFRYRGKLRALTALGNIKDNRSLLKYDMPKVFDKWKGEWEQGQEGKPQTEPKKKSNFKWLNPSSWFGGDKDEAVFDIQGIKYTESELRAGGWKESQIYELKKRSNE